MNEPTHHEPSELEKAIEAIHEKSEQHEHPADIALVPPRGDSNPEVAPVPADVVADIEKIDEALPNPHELAPPSAEPAPMPKPTAVEGTGDPRDTSKVDSLGNPKGAFPVEDAEYHGERKGEQVIHRDQPPVEVHDPLQGSGPRGANVSPEHLTEAQKAETDEAVTKRLQQGMSSTHDVDSIGNSKGSFRVEPQGNDPFGNRIPDKVTDEVIEEHPPMIGPRGKDAPKESFHKG